ncbi:hypothetical protein ACFQLX_07250 [Streptomyces polyrhachis]|uniref:Integral membrane protein n=1 Tax=Streptomyces polyrhachis TaxID=1282885 RepID=A0ABW2GG24_9ACTN
MGGSGDWNDGSDYQAAVERAERAARAGLAISAGVAGTVALVVIGGITVIFVGVVVMMIDIGSS